MQGIFIQEGVLSTDSRRPKSKKEVRELLAEDPSQVLLEATSMFGNEYGGPVSEAPVGRYYVVGPDPYTKRSFYGEITVRPDRSIKVT
jgi:hypothetical protein